MTATVRNTDRECLELSATLAAFSALVFPILALTGATLPKLDARAGGVQEILYISNDLFKILLVSWSASESADDSIIRVNKYLPFPMEA